MSLSQMVQPKRGYLANILTIPPLIYPFQYNPAQVTDSKQNKFKVRTPIAPAKSKSPGGALGAAAGAASGGLSLAGQLKSALETAARTFSKAELHELEAEGDRTLNFKFAIDGREKRPGEPDRRRNDAGHILGDLAILRSFMYPKLGDLLDILGAIASPGPPGRLFFTQPPTAVLVLGSLSMEGFVTDLKINETQFNADLNPTRAEVEMTLMEKTDSLSFIVDSIKRLGQTFYYTAYEDIGDVIL